MGSLIPGAEYIYEKADGITYSRMPGQAINERVAIGWDAGYHRSKNEQLWKDILIEAEHNPALQMALDRVILMYKLGKDKL